jgi:DNA repair exonuclease SbcCD ATPase subunit
VIDELTFKNWGKYRGTHTIRLSAGAFGVVAAWDGDDRRSNGGGKSLLLSSIGFLLFGINPKDTEDEWITDGEKSGSVEGKIGNWTIKRSRERGKSTQLVVGEAKGSDAQDVIEKQIVGLTRDEWVEACWLRQKKHAGMLVMSPADRMARVRQWCDLESLEKAEKEARRRLLNVDRVIEREQVQADTAKRAVERAGEQAGVSPFDANEVSLKLGFLKHAIDVNEREVNAGVELLREHGRIRREIDDRVRKRAKIVQLRAEADDLDGTLAPSPDDVREATEAHDLARETRSAAISAKQAASKLCGGSFDGHCPVNGRDCPVAGEIRADGESARSKLKDASERLLEAEKGVSETRAKENDLRRVLKEAESAGLRAELARKTAARLEQEVVGDDPPDPPDDAEVEKAISDAKWKLAEMQERRGHLRAALENGSREVERMNVSLAVIAEKTEERRLLRLACQVLGRSGAQRVLAEETVAEVEGKANDALARAGIRNTVSLSWGKPTQKRDPECPACEHTHPSTSKAAKCSKCGEERPFLRTEGLEIEVSDRGGAAEDLAGLTISLAAGLVVRNRRSSPWDVVLADEVFAACDVANSEALSRQLGQILGGEFGFRQSFVVAHSRKVVDSLPNRIVVEATDAGSTVRVE